MNTLMGVICPHPPATGNEYSAVWPAVPHLSLPNISLQSFMYMTPPPHRNTYIIHISLWVLIVHTSLLARM